jgi:hypothetical protein
MMGDSKTNNNNLQREKIFEEREEVPLAFT